MQLPMMYLEPSEGSKELEEVEKPVTDCGLPPRPSGTPPCKRGRTPALRNYYFWGRDGVG